MTAKEILKSKSFDHKLKRIHVNPEHHPEFKDFSHGAVIDNFIYGGEDDNGNQLWIDTNINALLSKKEIEVYNIKDRSNKQISDILKISEETVEAYRIKIEKKGF